MTRHATTASIDAHSLGVLPDSADDSMESLVLIDRERLIQRHQAQIQRLHEGVRQRAAEHAETIEALIARMAELSSASGKQKRLIDNLWMTVAFLAELALYFSMRAGRG